MNAPVINQTHLSNPMSPDQHALTLTQWHRLSQLGLKQSEAKAEASIETIALMEDATCLAILNKIQPELGAPNLKVTASLVIKRIAFLTLAPMLYAMSSYDKGLDVSIKQCIFEYPLDDRIWRSAMPLKSLQVSEPHPQQRASWREALLTQAFQGNLSLLVAQFHRLTRVQLAVLWENVAVRVFSIYERRILPEITQPEQARVAEADFAYLLSPDSAAVFGTSNHPIAPYFTGKSVRVAGQDPVRMRRTCCYYYRATDPKAYCGNCPLLCKQACHRRK